MLREHTVYASTTSFSTWKRFAVWNVFIATVAIWVRLGDQRIQSKSTHST